MKTFLLDLTEAELPDYWSEKWPRKIQVQEGRHLKELDVTAEEMAKPWAADHFHYWNRWRRKRGLPEASPMLPIGFNRYEMPKGAKLVELK
jgi:hypothetical protein